MGFSYNYTHKQL